MTFVLPPSKQGWFDTTYLSIILRNNTYNIQPLDLYAKNPLEKQETKCFFHYAKNKYISSLHFMLIL